MSPEKIKEIIIGVLIVLFLVIAGTAYSFYNQLQSVKNQLQTIKQDPQKVAKEEAKAIVAEVGQLIVLPEGEDPVIATVADPERLKDQLFFANAKLGDRVLIYPNAKKAILYDPVANKIIEVAPLNIGTPPATPPAETP